MLKRSWFILHVLTLLTFFSNAQHNVVSCADLKTGIFYGYPKNASNQYMDKREGDWVHETDLVTGDTSLWQIEWTNDCVYTLKYVSGSARPDAKIAAFLKKHILAIEIMDKNDAYYTFKSYIDKVSATPLLSDTIWLSQKLVVANIQSVKQIANSGILRKEHFNDTSKYAVVYLYRPGKITNGLASYPVYLDDDIICIAKNNSGYIFKVFKEGLCMFKSKLFKDESDVKLDIKFGKTYYVKSMIHWTISSRLYNFKLETVMVEPAKGQKEFDEVNLR